MTIAAGRWGRGRGIAEGGASVLVVAAVCFALLLAAAAPAPAQGKWQPTVSTTASDAEVVRRVAPAGALPCERSALSPASGDQVATGFAVAAGRVKSRHYRCSAC